MIDPINSTASDGASCGICGDNATGMSRVEIAGQMQDIPTCSECYHDQIVICPQCDKGVLYNDSVRVGAKLLCRSCAKEDAALTAGYMREHAHDEARDDTFNRR